MNDRIFVAQHSDLYQLKISADDEVKKKLDSWTVDQIRTWLGLRGVRSPDSLKEDLVRIAYFTWKLKIPVKPDAITAEREATERLSELLTVEEEVFPNPASVVQWNTDLKDLPCVTYGNIYNYLVDTPGLTYESLKAYKSLDGYNYAHNGFVQELHTHKVNSDYTFVKAKVKPSQHTYDPYDAWVLLHNDGSVEAARCTCTAGLGEVCSHVGALLFRALMATDLQLNEPEACTSRACQWNGNYRTNILPAPIDEIKFERPKYKKVGKRGISMREARPSSISSDSGDDDLWDIITEAAPDSVLLHMLDQPKCQSVLLIDRQKNI